MSVNENENNFSNMIEINSRRSISLMNLISSCASQQFDDDSLDLFFFE